VPSDDVSEFGGWPRPPRWVWAVAGVAAAAVLVAVVVARTGPHHRGASPVPGSPATAAAPVPGSFSPWGYTAWPSAAGACGLPVYLPQIRLAGHPGGVHGRVLVGGPGLRQVTLGGAVSRPLPGLPYRGRVAGVLVAGPGPKHV
jgi:hypothetical protein